MGPARKVSYHFANQQKRSNLQISCNFLKRSGAPNRCSASASRMNQTALIISTKHLAGESLAKVPRFPYHMLQEQGAQGPSRTQLLKKWTNGLSAPGIVQEQVDAPCPGHWPRLISVVKTQALLLRQMRAQDEQAVIIHTNGCKMPWNEMGTVILNKVYHRKEDKHEYFQTSQQHWKHLQFPSIKPKRQHEKCWTNRRKIVEWKQTK